MESIASHGWQYGNDRDEPHSDYGLAGFGLLCFCAWLSASADRAGLTGVAFAFAGVLILCSPVPTRIPGFCWIAAAVWFFGSLAAFLPADLMSTPAWRSALESAGIDTGWRITPQPLAALGSMATMTATGIVALWAANQQASRRNFLGMGFALSVAVYALAAWQIPGLLNHRSNSQGTFGFFPNRNHTATLLVTGVIVALGLLTHGIRRHRPWQIGSCSLILVFLLCVLFGLNISRAGIVLVCTGGVAWLILVGKRNLNGNAGKAVALLIGGSALIFLLLDTPVKRRLDQMIGPLSPDTSMSATDSIHHGSESSDGRLSIFRDTAAMIGDAPWTGWGQGQFAGIFPQYQEQSGDLTRSQCLHPESDWLWMAAESGVPATLALASLALGAIIPVVGSIRRGRSRTIRAGFLVAALILPLHGLFDVPGHGFSLLWTSALLLALAAGQRRKPRFPRTSAAGWRIAGICVAGFGMALLSGEWKGQPLLAADRSSQLFHEALEIYRQDHRAGAITPADGPDILLEGLEKLSEASALTPLDHRIRGLQGMLELHYDDMDELARRSFARQRALEPNWADLPLDHAAAWSKIDPSETLVLWTEGMRRAAVIEKRFPGTPWRELAYGKVLETARQASGLETAALEVAAGDAKLLNKARRIFPKKNAEDAP